MTDEVGAPVSFGSRSPDDGGSINTGLVSWCAIAGLGVLLAVSTMVASVAGARQPQDLALTSEIPIYVLPIITILCLVFWHLAPAKAWGWLLVVGAVLAFPLPVSLITGDGYQPSSLEMMSVLASPIVVTVAVVGAGVWLAIAGSKSLGATIVGTALLLQWTGVILGNVLFFTAMATAVSIVATVLVVAGVVGGLVAVVTRPGGQMGVMPSWRITTAGSVAVLASLIPSPMGLDFAPNPEFNYVRVGVVVLAIALVVGVVAGWRALLGAITLGMINGVIVILLTPTMQELHDMVGVALAGVGVGLALGLIAAYASSRSTIAITGLAAVSLAFFVLMIVLDPESDHFADAWEIATPVLLVVMLIAALAAIATIGEALAESAATPAVIVGLATPFQIAGLLFFLGTQANVAFSGPAINSLLIPSAVGLLIAAGALSVLINLARSTAKPQQEVTTDQPSS